MKYINYFDRCEFYLSKYIFACLAYSYLQKFFLTMTSPMLLSNFQWSEHVVTMMFTGLKWKCYVVYMA